MFEENTPGYFAVIPSEVRYDNRLCPNEKLMYGEISALANKEGFCWATNSYFAKLYDVDNRSVSSWISKLKKLGYIKIEMGIDASGSKRYIYINQNFAPSGVENNFVPPGRKLPEGVENNFVPPGRKLLGGDENNFQQNNTNTNNKNLINKKNNLINNSPNFDKLGRERVTYVVDKYNEICKSLPRVKKVTEQRARMICDRLETFTMNEILKAFEMAEASFFMTGKRGKWKASFNWFFENDENMLKVLEGNYSNNINMDTLAATAMIKREERLAKNGERKKVSGCSSI